jgi:hypothetical protein
LESISCQLDPGLFNDKLLMSEILHNEQNGESWSAAKPDAPAVSAWLPANLNLASSLRV